MSQSQQQLESNLGELKALATVFDDVKLSTKFISEVQALDHDAEKIRALFAGIVRDPLHSSVVKKTLVKYFNVQFPDVAAFNYSPNREEQLESLNDDLGCLVANTLTRNTPILYEEKYRYKDYYYLKGYSLYEEQQRIITLIQSLSPDEISTLFCPTKPTRYENLLLTRLARLPEVYEKIIATINDAPEEVSNAVYKEFIEGTLGCFDSLTYDFSGCNRNRKENFSKRLARINLTLNVIEVALSHSSKKELFNKLNYLLYKAREHIDSFAIIFKAIDKWGDKSTKGKSCTYFFNFSDLNHGDYCLHDYTNLLSLEDVTNFLDALEQEEKDYFNKKLKYCYDDMTFFGYERYSGPNLFTSLCFHPDENVRKYALERLSSLPDEAIVKVLNQPFGILSRFDKENLLLVHYRCYLAIASNLGKEQRNTLIKRIEAMSIEEQTKIFTSPCDGYSLEPEFKVAHQLFKLKQHAHKLEKKGHLSAAKELYKAYDDLILARDTNNSTKWESVLTTAKKSEVLKTHRGCKDILVNLMLLVSFIGVIYLACFKYRHGFFSPVSDTSSVGLLNNLAEKPTLTR